jgi:hypothetical protein
VSIADKCAAWLKRRGQAAAGAGCRIFPENRIPVRRLFLTPEVHGAHLVVLKALSLFSLSFFDAQKGSVYLFAP